MNTKFTRYWSPLAIIILLFIFLNGCVDLGTTSDGLSGSDYTYNDNSNFDSEGGSSGTGNYDAGGGSSGTGVTTISQGVVSGFGSIYMNGIIFSTTNAIITIDGIAANESDLRVGMSGRITGEADLDSTTGVASRIDIIFNIKGPVDEINLADNTLTVAGQRIIINPLSVFENGTLATLKLGDTLKVSGLSDMTGGPVYAGYIHVSESINEQIEIVGISNAINTIDKTFRIGTQVIEYSSAEFINMSEADFIDALPVRITGIRDAQSSIVASRIENLTPAPTGNENDTLIIEGIAESSIRLDALKQQFFEVSGITVFINTDASLNTTQFINGTPADIGYDTRLKVFGQFSSASVVNADSIEFYVPPNVSAVGNIESIDLVSNQVSIAGLSMQIDNSTQMLDVSSVALQKFSINDLSVGDQVSAYLYKSASDVRALFLRRDTIASESLNDAGGITLRGFANSTNSPLFKLGSIDIDTSATTTFFDPTRGTINSSEFFAAITGSSIVEANGRWGNNILHASSARFINLGNLTVTYTVEGSTATGSNDFFTIWDGTLNSEEDIVNGTSRENMFISNRQLILGTEWRVHDIRVFAPGRYSFDGCANNISPTIPCSNNIEMIVAENQIGAHMLIDWGGEINIDVINVWNKKQSFCKDELPNCSLHGLIANPVWDLASSDADGDRISGITLKDSNFANDLTVNFNLNFK